MANLLCKLYICIKKMSIYNKKPIPYNEIKDENFFRHQENEKNCNPDGSEQEAGCVLYESYTCLTFDGKRDYIDLGNCLHRLLQQRS